MASLKVMRGKWYARILIWDGARQREQLVPLRTESKVTARQRLSKVESAEPDNILSDERFLIQSFKQHRFDIIVDLNPVFHVGIMRLISLLVSDVKIGFTSPFSDKFYNIQLDISKSGIMEKGFKQINLILTQ